MPGRLQDAKRGTLISFSATECVQDSPVPVTFARGSHEHVDGASDRGQWGLR